VLVDHGYSDRSARSAPVTARTVLDPDLVSSLYRGHYVSLCRTARLLVDDPGRAEELVQDAFARTLAGRRAVREPAAALGYVRQAVVHACHSELRRRRVERRIGVGDRAAPLASADLLRTDARTADEIGDRDEVARLLRQLPARQRAAIVLRYYADLDEAAIAEAMSCSVGTVKSQLSKARHHLASLYDPRRETR
jgi:RNA polymerase sigma-70 factor (sigma-E family)